MQKLLVCLLYAFILLPCCSPAIATEVSANDRVAGALSALCAPSDPPPDESLYHRHLAGMTADDVPALVSALADSEPCRRVYAAALLWRLDRSRAPDLIPVLTDGITQPDERLRLRSLRTIAEIGPAASSLEASVREVAEKDPSGAVRDAAANALANISKSKEAAKKDKLFLMGIGMVRLNWTNVKGDEIRFRYSDLGLPAEFSTRERASFLLDGTFGQGKYNLDGHLDYDPENRITEPPLDFLITAGNEETYASVGDFRTGVFLNSIFSQYYHPFRGGVVGKRWETFGAEVVAGMARGESGIDEFPADSGAGPYYIKDSPILRGSEVVFLITKSAIDPSVELKRTQLTRGADYFLDYDRGAILFSYPLLPTDDLGNPNYIFITYQFESLSGRFTRDLLGFRAFVTPVKPLTATLAYIADADSSLDFGEAFDQRRGITTLGLTLDTDRVFLRGEFSTSDGPAVSRSKGLFGGGRINIKDSLRLYVNSWNVDTEFSTFANTQLQYGCSLQQVFPAYADRNIFLSPFQFSRNLGTELYPFSLSQVSVDEKEANGFVEWEHGVTRVSGGYGVDDRTSSDLRDSISYASVFHDGDRTKYWGLLDVHDATGTGTVDRDSRDIEMLLGARRRLWTGSSGDLWVQGDYDTQSFDDFLDLTSDTRSHSFSLAAEYLTGQEGYFAGYRGERLIDRDSDETIRNIDIFEAGIRKHFRTIFFVDSRIREERGRSGELRSDNQLISIGGGIERKDFRAQARYEIQLNDSGADEGRRQLWSIFVFGAPIQAMNLSLRYYQQKGRNESDFLVTESGEEELNFRLLWKLTRRSSVYSQWRYDTNIEIYPPLDRTKSNTLASVQGLDLKLTQKLDFLANYKLLKVYGPIDNRKESATGEFGYLVFRHFRFAVGGEYIDFRDPQNPSENYTSRVGYFKLVALF
ncbi:MAG: HEAT repeat domain-containing protein [Acidobacteriota bacterium]